VTVSEKVEGKRADACRSAEIGSAAQLFATTPQLARGLPALPPFLSRDGAEGLGLHRAHDLWFRDEGDERGQSTVLRVPLCRRSTYLDSVRTTTGPVD
jgi:hypothetical protein